LYTGVSRELGEAGVGAEGQYSCYSGGRREKCACYYTPGEAG
jgi:hypothetical protein